MGKRAPSKVNWAVRVPAVAAAVTYTSFGAPTPPVTVQRSDVAEDHAAVEHASRPRLDDGVRSTVRKLTPVTVTMPPSETAAFSAWVKLTTGAAQWQEAGG